MTWIHWLIILLLSLLAEVLTVNLVSIWFVAGAVAALIALAAGGSLGVQILLFCLISLIGFLLFLFVFRPRFNRVSTSFIPTNADRVIGEEALVTLDIEPLKHQGEVLVLGQVWSALAEDGKTEFPAQSKVLITAIRGVHVLVRPLNAAEMAAEA